MPPASSRSDRGGGSRAGEPDPVEDLALTTRATREADVWHPDPVGQDPELGWIDPPEASFKPRWQGPIMWVAASACVVASVLSLALGPATASNLIPRGAGALAGLVMAGAYLRARRMRLDVFPEGVRVVNYISSRTLPWSEIDRIASDVNGLAIVTTSGRIAHATSLRRSKWSKIFKRQSTTDRAIDYLTRRLGAL